MRAPFAAGALLAAAAYVALYAPLKAATSAPRLGNGLHSLLTLIGSEGRAVVAGVTVYLIGTIFVSAVRAAVRVFNLKLLSRVTTLSYVEGGIQSRTMSIVAPMSRPSLRRVIRLCEEEFGDRTLALKVCSEIILGGGKRLLVSSKDLYSEWDRLQSEAEFRDAVMAPAALFAIVALFSVEWIWWTRIAVLLILLAVEALLWISARQLDREATSMYAHAVADGLVATAQIDLLRNRA